MRGRTCVPSPSDDAQAYLQDRARLLRRCAATHALIDAWTAYRMDQQLPPEQRRGVVEPPVPLEDVEALHIIACAALREFDQSR